MEEARRKARELNGKTIQGRRIRAVMNTRPPGAAAQYFVPESVKVTNLDMAGQAHELMEIGGTYRIREVKSGIAYDLPTCIRMLEARMRMYGALPGSFQTAPLEGHRMQAKARFNSNEAAQRVFAAIEEDSFGHNPPFRALLPKGQQFTISIARQQYDSQRTLWDELAEGSSRQGAFVRVNESKSNGRMHIKVLGSNQKEVGALKVRVENLVIGERLAAEYWHSSFLGAAGNVLLKKIKDTTGAFITVDRRVQALRLFGTGPTKLAAKELIQEEVQAQNFLEWSIPLQRQAVAFFVRSGLKTLQDALGEDNVSLNLSTPSPTIKIKGGDDARHHLRKLIDEATALAQSGLVLPQRTAGAETCPICYDDVASPDTLSCGHTYCEGCLRHYITSAADSKTFPLVCMGNDAACNQPVAIPIIQRYLTTARMNRLVDAAFLAYLEQNPRTFKYCPTPDCSQIYRCDNNKESHQCPSCFFKICGRCSEEAHDRINCEEARVQRNPAEQERLNEEWAQRNNAKRCPECRVMIIKGEGCNHVECRCGAHICWRCMGVFSRADIYDHMQDAHGGIYEPEPVAAPRVAAPPIPQRLPVATPRVAAPAPAIHQRPPVAAPRLIPAIPAVRPRPPVVAVDMAQRIRQLREEAQQEADRRYAERLQAEQYGGWNLEDPAEIEAARRRQQEHARQQEHTRQQEHARQLLQDRQRENEQRERMREEMARAQRELNAREEARRRVQATQTATTQSEGGWCTIM
jgi:IBR domain, a half RING-finger domain/RING-type zinc-finger